MSVKSWSNLAITNSQEESLLQRIVTKLVNSVVTLCISCGAMYLMIIDSWCVGMTFNFVFFGLFLNDDYYLYECKSCMTLFMIDIGIGFNHFGLIPMHIMHGDGIHKYLNNPKCCRSMQSTVYSCMFVHSIIFGLAYLLEWVILFIFWPVVKLWLSFTSLVLIKINPRIYFDAGNIVKHVEYWLFFERNINP